MAALTVNDPALQPGFEHADTHVSSVICLYGFYGSPDWVRCEPGAPAAPIEHTSPDMPPMLIVHGAHDSFVAVSSARRFVQRCRTTAPANPVVYLELPGAQHTFDLYTSVRFHAVVNAVEAFTSFVHPPMRAKESAAARSPHIAAAIHEPQPQGGTGSHLDRAAANLPEAACGEGHVLSPTGLIGGPDNDCVDGGR
jgi:acetyl esterase/lipase